MGVILSLSQGGYFGVFTDGNVNWVSLVSENLATEANPIIQKETADDLCSRLY